MRVTRWQQFWKVDVPSSMIAQVWNGMISFGAAWFALAASETISVVGRDHTLTGVSPYVAQALDNGEGSRVGLAIFVMVTMVISVNSLFWRPITVWAERFRTAECEFAEQHRSWFLQLLRRSTLPSHLGRIMRPVGERMNRVMRVIGTSSGNLHIAKACRKHGDVIFYLLYTLAVAGILWNVITYVLNTVGPNEVAHAALIALITCGRVLLLIVFATLVWVPMGAWIGLSPRVTHLEEPVVEVLASFPTNFLLPLAAIVLGASGVSLNWGCIALMALGAQWYVLFNAIAGASAIPADLREAAANMQVKGWRRWKNLILPAIFPHYATGAIISFGGAWNASIQQRWSITAPQPLPQSASVPISNRPLPKAISRENFSAPSS
ncbi:ABC transporter permease subunit [Streptomyces kronopolitis]|uniref:ABC transporter permease subunit n=1 Tax=Streptomyces kronopolitis TaxID=1612435 RepID=UPI0036945F3D